MLRMDDERVGLNAAQIAIWKATHPDVAYADVPTSQEVADGPTDADETKDATEEARLRQLLTAWCKAILEYFCHAQK